MPQKLFRVQDRTYRRLQSVNNETPLRSMRRPTLESVEDSSRLAHAGSRMRLCRQQSGHNRDFTAYYRSSTNVNAPTYSIISHGCPPLARHTPKFPMYPVVQTLRWSPHLTTTAAVEPPTEYDEEHFTCHCDRCISKKCPSKRYKFKTNIMTFADQSTNTPKVVDVSIGSYPIMDPHTYDVWVNPSDVAVRDTGIQLEQAPEPAGYNTGTPMNIKTFADAEQYCFDLNPSPINDERFPNHCTTSVGDEEVHTESSSQRDDLDDYMVEPPPDFDPQGPVLVSRLPLKTFCKSKKKSSNNRKRVVCSGVPETDAIPIPDTPVCSKKFGKRKKVKSNVDDVDETAIPFSHRNNSRYHTSCKKSQNRLYILDSEELRHLVASPQLFRRTCMSQPVTYYRFPPSALPKRVLTSEKSSRFD